MSKVNNEQTEQINEEVKVTETTDLVVEETKKPLIGPKVKKGLKIAGVALAGGLVGFLFGRAGRNNDYEESENVVEVDYDVENSTEE